MTYLTLIIVAIVSFAIGRKTAKTFTPKQAEELKELRTEAREALTERTEKRKEQILNMMRKEAKCNQEQDKKGIARVDVEKLFDVSGATARKYLNELESENKIKQIGDSGRDVYYTLNT